MRVRFEMELSGDDVRYLRMMSNGFVRKNPDVDWTREEWAELARFAVEQIIRYQIAKIRSISEE